MSYTVQAVQFCKSQTFSSVKRIKAYNLVVDEMACCYIRWVSWLCRMYKTVCSQLFFAFMSSVSLAVWHKNL